MDHVAGFDFRAVNEAGNVAIDIEGYQANEYLLSRLDRLAPHNQRAMTEAARITAEEAAEAAARRGGAADRPRPHDRGHPGPLTPARP